VEATFQVSRATAFIAVSQRESSLSRPRAREAFDWGHFEVNHLVTSRWAAPTGGEPWVPELRHLNAHVTGKLEDRLHSLICAGKILLAPAQDEIATNWIAAYENHVGW
jgi:hypothetical protein